MSSQYSSPSPATRNAMLAVDTEEVAVLEASLHPTTEPPPAFPEEPEYAPPTDTPPSFGLEEYLRLSPFAIQRTRTKPGPQPRTTPIPPRTNTLPQDNPEDPRNLVRGLSSFARERLFYSPSGLAAAQLMLERQEEADHPLVLDPETNDPPCQPLHCPQCRARHRAPPRPRPCIASLTLHPRDRRRRPRTDTSRR
jgi:hypothetical protein